MTDHNTSYSDSEIVFEEFSPKKLILLLQLSKKYIISRWMIILTIGIIFGLAAALRSYLKKPTYNAEVTFALDESSAQNPKSDYTQLTEELGLPTLTDAGGIFTSLTNIIELMQSRLLVEKTLRSSVIVNSKPIVLADFFLDSLNFRDKWMKGSPYYHLSFLSAKKKFQDSLFENNIIRNIYETLITQSIVINKKGKGTSIISVSCTTENELFSKYFLETLVNEVTSYYIETKTQRALINVEFLQKRIDSIRNAYTIALYGKAAFSDANINPAKQIATVAGNKKETDIQILRSTYIDLVSSLESARTVLMRETPLFQYIDTPILPLKINKPGVLNSFIIFFIVGVFLIILYLLITKAIKFISRN